MHLTVKQYLLKLAHPFTISRETHTTQPSVIACLSHNGKTGYGEATSNPYYNKTAVIIEADLLQCWNAIKQQDFTNTTPTQFWDLAHTHLKDNLFALCALDMAFNDLYAKLHHKKLYEIWEYNTQNNPLTDYTIGIDTIEKMVAKMQEMPWPIYKIKLGTKNDIAIVTELRKHTNSVFRIDANCGWTADETIKNAVQLKELGVEFLEQPLPADDWTSIKKVFENSVLPIIADESCIVETDVEKCYNHYHGVNVKLTKCGGLTPARRMIAKAKELGMKTMVGCMTESTVGISAIGHLLPQLDYVDMDGALLLSEDIATGVTIKDGIISYANENGTGVNLL